MARFQSSKEDVDRPLAMLYRLLFSFPKHSTIRFHMMVDHVLQAPQPTHELMVQILCGLWLAIHRNNSIGLPVERFAAQSNVNEHMIYLIESGCAEAKQISSEERERLIATYAQDDEEEFSSFASVLDLALGANPKSHSEALGWVAEDMEVLLPEVVTQPIVMPSHTTLATEIPLVALPSQPLTDLQYALLRLLSLRDAHSLSLKRRLYLFDLPEGQAVEAALDDMCERGWILETDEKIDPDVDAYRTQLYFKLAPAGSICLDAEKERRRAERQLEPARNRLKDMLLRKI